MLIPVMPLIAVVTAAVVVKNLWSAFVGPFTKVETAKTEPVTQFAPAATPTHVVEPSRVVEPVKTAKSAMPSRIQKKPDYQVLKPGSVILVDSANLFNKVAVDDAEAVLTGIHREIEARGYKPMFFMEYRTRTWLLCNQTSAEKRASLAMAIRELGVTLVLKESDNTMLQCAQTIGESVICTNDHLRDYKAAFPQIVGTSRVRPFTCTKFDDRYFFTIDGFDSAIVVSASPVEEAVEEVVTEKISEAPAHPRFGADEKKGVSGMIEQGSAELEKGHAEKALKLYRAAMRKRIPESYQAMSDFYFREFGAESKQAKNFAKLAAKTERKNRDLKRRDARCARLAYEQRLVRIGHRIAA